MTNVTLDLKDGYYSIECEGHATGSAEVCAGISALMFSLEFWGRDYGDSSFTSEFKPGYAKCRFRKNRVSTEIFRLVANGLRMMEESDYNDYIYVKDMSGLIIRS